MTHEKTTWTDARQLSIYAQSWFPESTPSATVAMVHGMGEHSDRYDEFARDLAGRGFACIAYDHPGHGQSGGKRGHAPNYDYLLDGIDRLLSEADKLGPGPVFLYGHSMGGNLVLNYALRRKPQQLRGLIVSAPWLRLAFQPPAVKLQLARLMNKLYPSYTENSDLDGHDLTRDQAIATAYNADPLVHGQISTRFFTSVVAAGRYALDNAAALHLPTLLMHGTDDRATSYEASAEFAERAPDSLLDFRTYDNWFHELHNEPERADLYESVAAWIGEKL